MQVGGRKLDVGVLALPGPRLGGEKGAAVDVLEIAVGELVAALVVPVLLVVDAEVPAGVGTHPVLGDEGVLLPGRGLVLAPLVALVADHPGALHQRAGVVVTGLVQTDGHDRRPPIGLRVATRPTGRSRAARRPATGWCAPAARRPWSRRGAPRGRTDPACEPGSSATAARSPAGRSPRSPVP